MARVRSPNRDKAFEIYKEHDGKITNRDIAKILNISEKTVGGWKCKDAWDNKFNGVLQKNERSTPKDKKELQRKKTQRNRSGNPNPKNQFTKRNKAAEKHGFFSKYLPEETLEIMEEIETKAPLDMLWDQITIQYAAIIRAQKIMHVTDKEEMIKELKKDEYSSFEGGYSEKKEYEFQFAWDRQATFLNAQSRAISELRSLVKNYLELEGIEKDKSKVGLQDWKSAIQKIAERRKNRGVKSDG